MTDREPFDNAYTPPASEVARAIQFPLDEKFAERVVNAYARDAYRARKKEVAP